MVGETDLGRGLGLVLMGGAMLSKSLIQFSNIDNNLHFKSDGFD